MRGSETVPEFKRNSALWPLGLTSVDIKCVHGCKRS